MFDGCVDDDDRLLDGLTLFSGTIEETQRLFKQSRRDRGGELRKLTKEETSVDPESQRLSQPQK